jgi:hypothetical protein
MKKLILSVMLVAFAVAVQAGGEGCCAAKAAQAKTQVSAKVDGKTECTAGAKQACSADSKQACTAQAKQACSADSKQACSADAKQACSTEVKAKAQCAAGKSCCGKDVKQVKQPLKSPKAT